jgi:MinD superfamily P-loop ATPase
VRQLSVISGKGGTGKTTVTAALAQLLKPAVLADCDVEAPNLHLLLSPRVERSFILKVSSKAVIDPLLCDDCGACGENCRYGAIAASPCHRVDPFRCEGCRVCGLVCPQGAVSYLEPDGAEVFIASTPYGPMVGAELAIGEEASGKVVSRVRMEAQLLSMDGGLTPIIVDGSPGTGCPVIASISGVDLAVVVTEPTVSGSHDLDRILGVTGHFGVPAIVCINKWDINPHIAWEIEGSCGRKGIEVVARIPFREEAVEALRRGLPPIGNVPAEMEAPLSRLAEEIAMRIASTVG